MTSKYTASQTLSLLEERLRRIDYILNGHNVDSNHERVTSPDATGSAAARVRNLERSLQAFSNASPTVADILALQRKHPEVFHASSDAEPPTTLTTASLASLVLAHANLYQSASARLPQLQETSVPDPAAAAKLIELQPLVEKARARQIEQLKEVAELRTRSAKVVYQWYESGVLGMGEQWAEWEERLRDAEILVRRREATKQREAAPI